MLCDIRFYKEYPDELSCKLRFKEIRDQEGIICKKCNCTDHYWKKDKWSYECKKCKFRASLRSGTVMQSSKLSFQYWFIAMHLITSTKKSFSAKEMQRQLGHKRYEPIWSMMHKIRSVMGLRDAEHQLSNWIELDKGFFETVDIIRFITKNFAFASFLVTHFDLATSTSNDKVFHLYFEEKKTSQKNFPLK